MRMIANNVHQKASGNPKQLRRPVHIDRDKPLGPRGERACHSPASFRARRSGAVPVA